MAPPSIGSVIFTVAGALFLGLSLLFASSDTKPAPPIESIAQALETDRSTQAARGRLEFVGAMELRLDRLERLHSRLETKLEEPAPTLEIIEELHDELREEVLELKTEPEEDWRDAREELLSKTDELQDAVLRLVESA